MLPLGMVQLAQQLCLVALHLPISNNAEASLS
jgi:hypothetical protein